MKVLVIALALLSLLVGFGVGKFIDSRPRPETIKVIPQERPGTSWRA